MKKYAPRIADGLLQHRLQRKGAVLIQGPKWCGKTTTAEQQAKSILYMDDVDTMRQNIELADLSPKTLLMGDTPRLIDEWQLAPQIWDAVRYEVDHRDGMGHFILTGSAVPADNSKIHHSGTGRFSWFTMRTMSLYESGDSNGEVSLRQLFENKRKDIVSTNKHKVEDIAWLICRGGWPKAIELKKDIALSQAYDYFDGVVNSDISRVDGIRRNPERTQRILRSLARNQATQTTVSTICSDIENNDRVADIRETVTSYLEALKKIFVLENSPAWNPNLRSKTAIRTSETYYFSDPSIGVAALGLGPEDLINHLKTMGIFFETLCVRDLRVYADALDGSVYHYRDKSGLECDAVIHLRNGKYGLVEIKLGGDDNIESGAKNLKTLAEKIDSGKMNAPSFMMVLTGVTQYAYCRKDGVWVVPIGCLRE